MANEMGYMEPPWTQQAPRQCLGYILLHDGQYEAAKDVYHQDLVENPKNPWSTLGLAQVYEALDLKDDQQRMMLKYQSMGAADLGCSCPMLRMK